VPLELVQRLGIADQVLPKSRLIGGSERVGAVMIVQRLIAARIAI
jgi:hypothetical protein